MTVTPWLSVMARHRNTVCGNMIIDSPRFTGNPPYSISPYSAVKRYSGKGDTTLHDAPPVRCGQSAVSAAGPPGGITW